MPPTLPLRRRSPSPPPRRKWLRALQRTDAIIDLTTDDVADVSTVNTVIDLTTDATPHTGSRRLLPVHSGRVYLTWSVDPSPVNVLYSVDRL